jgi:dihydrofolate reductase
MVSDMRKVIFRTSLSLDGYIDASSGDPSWLFPDEELHRHFNDLERDIDTHLYGRRMYELMAAYWPTADQNPTAPQYEIEYARIWKAVPKVVFSSRLQEVSWNARMTSHDALAEVVSLKDQPGKNLSVGGLHLASSLATGELIDEYRFYFVPILLGSGKAAFSELRKRVRLQPVETRTFTSGTVLVRCVPAGK